MHFIQKMSWNLQIMAYLEQEFNGLKIVVNLVMFVGFYSFSSLVNYSKACCFIRLLI